MLFYTYAHYTADTNEIFYIGKGRDRRHLCKRNRNTLWRNIAAKHGWRAEILAWWSDEHQAFEHERLLIDCLGRRDLSTGQLCNMTDGGDGISGHTHSAEARAKISVAMTGKPGNNKGMIHSADARAKMSAAKKGKPGNRKGMIHSAETRAKIGAANKGNTYNLGRTHSAETRAKMSASQKGKTLSAEHRAKIGAAGKGRTHSANTRAKLSAANKGKTFSAEHRAKLSAAAQVRVCNPHTAETRAKMSAARTQYWARKKSGEIK